MVQRLGQVKQGIVPSGKGRVEVHQIASAQEDVTVVGVAMPDDGRPGPRWIQQSHGAGDNIVECIPESDAVDRPPRDAYSLQRQIGLSGQGDARPRPVERLQTPAGQAVVEQLVHRLPGVVRRILPDKRPDVDLQEPIVPGLLGRTQPLEVPG